MYLIYLSVCVCVFVDGNKESILKQQTQLPKAPTTQRMRRREKEEETNNSTKINIKMVLRERWFSVVMLCVRNIFKKLSVLHVELVFICSTVLTYKQKKIICGGSVVFQICLYY